MARKNQYEIGVGMDTGPFEKSVSNGLVDPLEKAADAFEGLEDAAKSADLDKELDKAADRTNVLSKELDDARDGLKRLGYAARDAGDDAKRGMDGASEGAATLKDEAKQSARETAASFRDVTDVLDLVQEVAANALGASVPPVSRPDSSPPPVSALQPAHSSKPKRPPRRSGRRRLSTHRTPLARASALIAGYPPLRP